MRRDLLNFYRPDTVIKLRTSAGSSIGDCAHEAASMALEENVTVEFIHNGRLYSARPSNIVADIVAIGVTVEEGAR